MKKGFTLIEVMIASVLLVSFMGAYLGTYHSFMSSAQQSKALYQALSSCFSKFEEISGHDFGSIVADYNTTDFSIYDNFGNQMGLGIIEVDYAGSNNWTNVTSGASWNPRTYFASLNYDNKMWVIGGLNISGAVKNDVWNSTNGLSWTIANNSAKWSPRRGHTSLVYDNKMWVIGGFNNSAFLNDVWYSVDGKIWYNATSTANWAPRYAHTSLVYDNKMWVMGGLNGSITGDIWYSNNGVNWTNTPKFGWNNRYYFASLVYDNKMWVMGGFSITGIKNDVWWTNDTNLTDGQTWTLATSSADWTPRYILTALVYDNKMWVMGGTNGVAYNNDRVWYSTNGVNWVNVTASTIWTPRGGHTVLVYDNKMWVMGGADGVQKSDVWYSTGGNRLLNVSILASFRTPNNRITGEDRNLNGVLDAGEDTITVNGKLDSPVQLRGLVSERKGGTFLGRPQE